MFSRRDFMKVNGMDAAAVPVSTQQKISGLKLRDGVVDKSIALVNEREKIGMPLSEKAVLEAIEKANRAVESFAYTSFEYSVHKKTGAIMVKVVDRETKQLLREVPPEKLLDMLANLIELSGVIVDERR
jgi:flagellar protein FlaG